MIEGMSVKRAGLGFTIGAVSMCLGIYGCQACRHAGLCFALVWAWARLWVREPDLNEARPDAAIDLEFAAVPVLERLGLVQFQIR